MLEERKVPFAQIDEVAAFEKSLITLVQQRLLQVRTEIMPPENTQGYYHGTEWQTLSASDPEDVGKLTEHSHETEIKFDDIINNRIEKIDEYVNAIVMAMHHQFMQSLYATVSAACDKSGNVVSFADFNSPAEGFLQILKKIEFGVDRNGKPSIPELHLGPKVMETLIKDIERQGPEFQETVEKIKAEKMEEAKAREKDRVSKFLGPN